MIFLCRPFVLQTINMVTLPACYMKYCVENNRQSYTTPYLKTHVAGEYTNTHRASALMLRQANT